MKRLHLYSLGPGAKHSPNHICCPVPKKINEEEIFFGPCMADLRKILFKDYLKEKVQQGKERSHIDDEIYLVGINSTKTGLPRRIIWAGKIKELSTFKGAWDKVSSTDFFREKYSCLITGDEHPLHVKPILNENKDFIGYKYHKKGTHITSWVKDLSSYYKNIKQKFNVNVTKEEIRLKENSIREEILNRDICLWLENIFFVNNLGINLDDDFLNILRELNIKKKDTISNRNPFGETNGKPIVFRTQGFVIKDNYVDDFIQLIRTKKKELPILKILKK